MRASLPPLLTLYCHPKFHSVFCPRGESKKRTKREMKVRDVLYGESRRKLPDIMDGVLAVWIMWDNLIYRDTLWNPMQMKYWPQRRFERQWINCRLIIMHVTRVECTEPNPALRSLRDELLISSEIDRKARKYRANKLYKKERWNVCLKTSQLDFFITSGARRWCFFSTSEMKRHGFNKRHWNYRPGISANRSIH